MNEENFKCQKFRRTYPNRRSRRGKDRHHSKNRRHASSLPRDTNVLISRTIEEVTGQIFATYTISASTDALRRSFFVCFALPPTKFLANQKIGRKIK